MARRISCEQISPLLSAYLDGELSQAERESVEWHLKECEVCRSELKELQEAKRFALQLSEVQPPLSLRQRIMARVEREKECQTVRPLIGAYLDEELTQAERRQVERHLTMCKDCHEELETEKKVREVLQILPEVEPPLNLRARIYASIERKPLFLRRFAIGFATLAAAASLVLFFLPSHQAPTSPQTPRTVIVAQKPTPSKVEATPRKGAKVTTSLPQKGTSASYKKPIKTVVATTMSQHQEKASAVVSPRLEEAKEETSIIVSRPVVLPRPSAPAATENKEEAKMAAQPQIPQEITPTPSTSPAVKVAIRPQPSLSDVLKDITRSVDKPSLPTRLTERLNKSIVIGVAKIEF